MSMGGNDVVRIRSFTMTVSECRHSCLKGLGGRYVT